MTRASQTTDIEQTRVRKTFVKKLKTRMRKILALVFRISGLPVLIREVLCRNKVTLLVYHNPDPGVFRKHMDYLSRHYHFITLERLVGAMEKKDWSAIPSKGLVIVFDDGLKDIHSMTDTFRGYKVCPTIYLCSHIVNTNRKFWFDAGYRNHHSLKKVPNEIRLNKLLEVVGYEQRKEYNSRQALNLEEIRAMTPYVDFQSHSRFHPVLTNCSDEECRDEIVESKLTLEKILNKPVEHFCYPNGDYTEREVSYVEEAGYRSARTVDAGWNKMNSDRFKLKAMYVDNDASISVLNAQVAGFFAYVRYLRFGSFNGKHPPYT
jgi:peptidoglycan/xylan/chitin deacetylase (PgdA/CDA1 family)